MAKYMRLARYQAYQCTRQCIKLGSSDLTTERDIIGATKCDSEVLVDIARVFGEIANPSPSRRFVMKGKARMFKDNADVHSE
jgi:hypothetical protein